MNVLDNYTRLVATAKSRYGGDSWDGRIADPGEIPCKACGKPLNAAGMYPAETYMGTFNGLCYPCTGAGPFLLETEHDGAEWWSHPPHCPSWRRDRERFLTYADCDAVRPVGREVVPASCYRTKGAVHVSRSDAHGGSYNESCGACWARWSADPIRTWHDVETKAAKARADAEYKRQVLAALGLKKFPKGFFVPMELQQSVSDGILPGYRAEQVALDAEFERRKTAAGGAV